MKTKTKGGNNLSNTRSLQLQYWQGLQVFMKNNNSIVTIKNPEARNYTTIRFGITDFDIAASVNSRAKTISIWFNLWGDHAKENFQKLYSEFFQSSLVEISGDLKWEEKEKRQQSAIILLISRDFSIQSEWPAQFEWFQTHLEKFLTFFEPKVKAL